MFGTVLLDFSLTGVLTAAGVVGATGLIIGILLCIAAKKLAVKTDERVEKVRGCLPGSNCGGCGFTGCDACAEAIVSGAAPVNACTAGGDAAAIAEVLGTEAVATERKVAFVKCSGTCDKVTFKYEYRGISDCRKLALIPGHGEKECSYGCMGYGSCVSVCKFGAISIKDGVAFVDKEKCVGCGACAKVCPNRLIELRPYESWYGVACSSHEKGKAVKDKCLAGCIGCGICAKFCPIDAITVVDNIAHIDQSLCVGCGTCNEKCPQKVVKIL
ncbi:MAG: RnfABCDGE type electron transport complex subunit B [Lachnospiraceae bacterium]|nr:RnfABCDGE type electron transport complex subunit B [Lachnospiraceae bacterium]